MSHVDLHGQLHPGYPATEGGQLEFLRDLLAVERALPAGAGRGVLSWEPAFLSVPGGPPDPWENLTIFDFDGDALAGIDFAAPRDSSAYATVQVVGDFNGWDTGVPSMTEVEACVWLDTLDIASGCYLFKFRTGGAWDLPLDYGGCVPEDPACLAEPGGPVCLGVGPAPAIGEILFATSGPTIFRLDEREGRYSVLPLERAATPAPVLRRS
jgi:hypothetical protein